jgi:hypothetical protein
MMTKYLPAFPCEVVRTNEGFIYEGMTLRDYFAAKAMQGIVADPDLAMGCDKIAEWAYTQADAMLKARDAG